VTNLQAKRDKKHVRFSSLLTCKNDVRFFELFKIFLKDAAFNSYLQKKIMSMSVANSKNYSGQKIFFKNHESFFKTIRLIQI
jgi:Mor family transcriptional regulator